MRMHRAKTAVGTGASVALLVALGASGALAKGLVAPVTAGPPKPPKLAHLDLNGFFPSTTTIHVGDSVRWSINGFHSVTFLSGKAAPALIIPAPGNLVSGRLDAKGSPFWFNGQPNQIINPVVAAPSGGKTYNGKGFLNSGLPSPEGPPKPFVVKFTKAGTFRFNCLVHPGMKGVVKVLPKRKTVPSAGQDRAAASAQAAAAISQARSLAKVKPPANTVFAGHDGSGTVAWLRFFPESLSIKAGTTVNFQISSQREVHTITFGTPAYTAEIEKSFTAPQPGPAGVPPTLVVNPLAAYPSDPPPLPSYTGENHGNGFENAGILSLGGPLPSSAKITFTKPGVYHFECVIHENMDGTITVTA